MPEKQKFGELYEKIFSLKIPLNMIIAELSFYDARLDFLSSEQIPPELSNHIREVLQTTEVAVELLSSIQKKLSRHIRKKNANIIKDS
jgi:hypothetical protein